MDRRRVRGLVFHGLVAPAVTVGVVVGLARVVGVSVGLSIFGLSVVAAAGFAAVLLADTRSMQSDTSREAGGIDARNPVGVRNELTDTPDVSAGNERVAARYAGGLFVLTVFLVLYLGGLFGG